MCKLTLTASNKGNTVSDSPLALASLIEFQTESGALFVDAALIDDDHFYETTARFAESLMAVSSSLLQQAPLRE